METEEKAPATSAERLREVVLDLEIAKARERELRDEATALLGGLRAISEAASPAEIFQLLLEALRAPLGFDAAFVLRPVESEGVLVVEAATDPVFAAARFSLAKALGRTLRGRVSTHLDAATFPDWQEQPEGIRERVGSALCVPIKGERERALLVFTHPATRAFQPRHEQLARRLLPLATQALRDAEHRAQIARTNRDMRLVLDNVGQGLLTIGRDLAVVGERSAIVDQWFGTLEPGTPFDVVLARKDSQIGASVAELAALVIAGLPVNLLLEGLPRQVQVDSRVLRIDYRPVPDSDDWTRMLVVLSDITAELENRQMQAQLLQADRLGAVGLLAAGIAHEINNPLAYVIANLGFLDELLPNLIHVIARPGDLVAQIGELKEAVAEARDGADRVRHIVRDLKMFSRVDEETRAAVDVQEILENTFNLAHNEIRHRARLVKIYGIGVPAVEANAGRLGQVFLNLIINAAHAIPEGDALNNEIRITTRFDASHVEIEVRDTGSGIEADVQARIFDPFFTTKAMGAGTGLGLSICHGIVTGLGGEIRVDSVVGQGTAFCVRLPRSAAPSEPRIKSLPAAPYAQRGRILVIDDELMVGKALRRGLKEHDVTVTTDAKEGLALATSEPFDLILCDLMMPEMTGMDLHAELARVSPKRAEKVVFMTGGAFTPRARALLDDVPNQHIEKPFEMKNVRAIVAAALRDPALEIET